MDTLGAQTQKRQTANYRDTCQLANRHQKKKTFVVFPTLTNESNCLFFYISESVISTSAMHVLSQHTKLNINKSVSDCCDVI